MKRLSIELLPDASVNTGYYLPGDTFGGHVHLHTTSAIKYTCIKIRFIGHISTKIAKAEEGIYVQNQQVVLIGNANNTAESQLEEGKYSWPFEFTFPLQHLPSSGKYRHGSVKYMLVASMTATGFLGSMQEHKTTQQVQLKDLINIQAEPYSDSLLVESSVKTKAQSTRTKDFASVKVQLARSAFLRGQQLSVVIDISHPRKIRRSPGCWVQLIRKEHYYAGDHAREYTDVIANTSQGVSMDSASKSCRVLAELTIPLNTFPSMTTTKAILIEYYLNIILDLRESTGFMERGFNRKLKAAQKEKLLGCPGGAEIQVPVIIGTLSDLLHTHKPSPFTLVTDTLSESVWSQNSTPTVSPTTSPSLAASSAMAATSKPNVNNSFSSFDVYPTHSPYNATCSSNERSSHTQALTQQQIMATFGRTEGSFSNPSNPNLPSGEPPRYTQGPTQATPLTLNTLLTTAADQTDSTDVDTANRNRRHSSSFQLNGSHSHPHTRPPATPLPYATTYSRSQSSLQQGSFQRPGNSMAKPLPSLPPHPPQHLQPSPSLQPSGSRSLFLPPTGQVGHQRAPSFIPPLPTRPSMTNLLSTNSQHLGPRAPQLAVLSLPPPPPNPPQLIWQPNGYPLEKNGTPQLQPIPLPVSVITEVPTAPRAVDVGLGPSSPPMHNVYPSMMSPIAYCGSGLHPPIKRNPSTTEYGSDYRS